MTEPLCRFCLLQGRTTPALVADHVTPHRGDINSFWTGRLQSLCADCHDTLKRQQETRGFATGCGLDGMPTDRNHPAWSR
jgi:5-methylcytosine-specific restriction endonuclease McrA